ncbi:MAG: formylglycine-generating enzyme family protein [Aureispira sp.]|nr:formylglycine-generating enzyme family protein [Aureispira sp.]
MEFRVYIIIIIWSFSLTNLVAQKVPKGMVLVPKGAIPAFYMDETPVTVKQFREFVKATAYQTEAEQLGDGSVYNFRQKEWELKKGAYWEYPFGTDQAKANAKHPVTQISWNDAQAYCKWAKKRLPSAKEWEYAARNAQNNQFLYPWGNELIVEGKYKANCWQGSFPDMNLMKDGFRFTSPVGHYGKSSLGLADLSGNVWEWLNDEVMKDGQIEKVQKGGSFMCEKTVCHGYQISAQTSASANSALFHVGFRCVKDLE